MDTSKQPTDRQHRAAPPHASAVRDEPVCQVAGLHPDDVAAVAAPAPGELWCAWGRSTLATEEVELGRLSLAAGGPAAPGVVGRWPGCRPALSRSGDRVVVAWCMPRGGRLVPALVEVPPRPAGGLSAPAALDEEDAVEVSLVAAAPDHWLAWTTGGGPAPAIRIARVGPDGGARVVGAVAGASPALAGDAGGTWVAWVHDHRVMVGRVGPGGVDGAEPVGEGRIVGRPVITRGGQDELVVLWHQLVGDGVLRWIQGVQGAPGRWERLSPPVAATETDQRGEDQGWENPSAARDRAGTLWVAGRSSQGFHTQALGPGGWTRRHEVTAPGWSSRSRSCGLVSADGGALLVRGSPAGLLVTRLQLERTSTPPAQRTVRPCPRVRVRARPTPREPGLLFGDIHQHTQDSDGTGELAEAYRQARDHLCHDVVAITDHEKLGKRSLGPLSWQRQLHEADAWYEPGRLVTLRAYEFTGSRLPGPGHKCVYFGDSVPGRLPDKDSSALWSMVRAHGAFAVPHHVAWTGADLAHHDPELQPVWEICSVHGAYEHGGDQRIPPRPDVVLDGQFIRDALDAGHVFGFVGGTDSHGLRWHHGVGRRADPLSTGLTAVFAEPTREAVLAALRARRCYATSGPRIVLRVDVQGAPMGSVIRHRRAPLHAEATGTAPIAELAVVQDGEIVARQAGGTRARIDTTIRPRGARSYAYVRVLQEDGEMAWSSPVWIG